MMTSSVDTMHRMPADFMCCSSVQLFQLGDPCQLEVTLPEILPDDVQALRHALDASSEDVTVTLSLTRRSAEKVLELLEAEHSTGAVVIPVKDLFTSTEAAAMLGMSRPTLMKLVDAGIIDHVRVGTHHRISMRAIVDYQRRRKVQQEERAAAIEEFRSNMSFGGKQ